MNIIGTNNALISHVLASTIADIDTSTDISWSNTVYDPTGKDAWLDIWYNPVDFSSTTKSKTVGQTESGFLQVSVYVPSNDQTNDVVNYSIRQLQIINDVLTAFADNTLIEHDGVRVNITNSNITSPRTSGGWYVRDITINYIKFGE